MQIDLGVILTTVTGKPLQEIERNMIGAPVLDSDGNPKMKGVSMWIVIEGQLNQYQGGEGMRVMEIGSAMVEAMKNKSETIDISTEAFTFLKNKIVLNAKIPEHLKEQIKAHLASEDSKHEKVDEKKKEEISKEEKSVVPANA